MQQTEIKRSIKFTFRNKEKVLKMREEELRRGVLCDGCR